MKTIFVVEDDKNINEVVSEYLKESGFTVISSGGGAETGSIIAQNSKIDLFILDIMLPEISGLELLAIIRNNEIHRSKPVIMLTALSDESTQLNSFEGLADDYITKPFSPRILVKRVEALFRRTYGFSDTVRIGDVIINFDSHEASESGQPVRLTTLEFEIMKVLSTNCKKVLTRDQILNIVWGYDYFGDQRIVDVHIKNLRKKFKQSIITTVKGVGYTLANSINYNANAPKP